MKTKDLVCLFVGVCLLVVTGCNSFDSMSQGFTKMTDPDKMTIQHRATWANPWPNLRPVSPSKKVVYLKVKNSSDSNFSGRELTNMVKGILQEDGYRITNNIDEAHYYLNANIRAFGVNAAKVKGLGSTATTIGGAVAGAAIGHAAGHSRTSTGIGAAGGALIGAGLADIAANRNKMVTVDLVIDVSVGERVAGGVVTTKSSGDASNLKHQYGASTSGGVESGNSNASFNERQQIKVKDDFFYYRNRVTAWAKRIRLTPEEAEATLKRSIINKISGILP